MKANRYGVTVSAQAGEQLKELQKIFERKVGFEPSLAHQQRVSRLGWWGQSD
jgi:hypothetical protein